MSRRTKLLSDEDRVLWRTVAETVEPLRKPRPRKAKPPAAPPPLDPAPAPASAPPVTVAEATILPTRPRGPKPPATLDRPTHDKLAKGRVPIEGRVDLHGLFQDEAHALLLSFLRQAQARGIRHVLVITGKGFSSGGVLRRMAPAWLGTAPFRELVSGFDEAARGHGGGGALYVRLKRRG